MSADMRPISKLLALLAALAALAVVTTALPGCGEDKRQRPTITVSAASSLKAAFTAYAEHFRPAAVRLQFAGSDELAAQIRRGGHPDVFAAANTTLPDRLHAEGLVERPIPFAQNRLVLAVPAKDAKVHSLEDLERDGTTIAIGAASVPVGSYTREVLARLGPTRARRVLANVRSNEPDVAGVVGKLSQGAVDAGFVYVTDVNGSGGKLRAIDLPVHLRPQVTYAAAVVRGTKHRREASAFIVGLLRGPGAAALRARGFTPPPRRT